MSAILVSVVSLFLLAAGYILYSPKIAKWMSLDLNQKTPAEEFNDGIDYVPARHWTVLFGHHFASIAGAAPIIGPVIACLYWGWLPAVLWIVIGGTLFGAVHDFSALIMSAQREGRSIATITESVMGRSAKIVFSIFAFLALILIVAVFAAVAGRTLATTPKVVIPTFGLVLVAMITGFLMYRVKLSILLCSVIGLFLLFALILAGLKWEIRLPVAGFTPEARLEKATAWWTVILLVYGLVASVTPVTILLQPRDHLAAGVLFVGMTLGFGGLLVSNPSINSPAIVKFSTSQGYIWPMLFVTIACGAISGFHSLVASGTTSKQLPGMKDARVIGYGGMIMESALSILAVIAVAAGLLWMDDPEGTGLPVYQDVFKQGGWIKAFGHGYGQLTGKLLSLLKLDALTDKLGIEGVATASALGMVIGITMLKTFVMTTLDSATRITRYLCAELFGEGLGIKPLKNKYIATLLVGILSGWLALGNWKAIWPVFGAANQLIASLVFLVVGVYMISRGSKYLFVVIPGVFMLITTIGALVYQTSIFVKPSDPKYILATISVALIFLALFLLYFGIRSILRVKPV